MPALRLIAPPNAVPAAAPPTSATAPPAWPAVVAVAPTSCIAEPAPALFTVLMIWPAMLPAVAPRINCGVALVIEIEFETVPPVNAVEEGVTHVGAAPPFDVRT